jgi:DNA polymerase
MTREEKEEALRLLTEEQLPIVTAASDLYKTATQAVPGDGNADAEVMFIGEAPGQREDEIGKPFVGAAGQFLNQLLESIGLQREDVYIANCIKHRPPGNRDPLPQEIAAYGPWLQGQIDIIDPKLIVTLGRFSMEFVLGPGFSISKIHGQPKRRNGRVVMPMYHPAAALYSGNLRPVLAADFQKIPKVIEIIKNPLKKETTEELEEKIESQQRLL